MSFAARNVIYDRRHLVKVKYPHSDVFLDEKTVAIKVTSGNDDVLSIKLFDTEEVSFNYSADIDLCLFSKIKSEQSLDIDFDEFKTQLVELLGQTLINKMMMRLEIDDKTCRIVFYEKSKIKSLIFLTVDLQPTDCTAIIEELSCTITQLKGNNKNLEGQLAQARKHLQERDVLLRSAQEITVNLERNFLKDLKLVEDVLYTKAVCFEKAVLSRLIRLSQHVQKVFHNVDRVKMEITAKDEAHTQLMQTLQTVRGENDKNIQALHSFRFDMDCLRRQRDEAEQECYKLKQTLKHREQAMDELKRKCDEQANDLEKATIVIVQKQQAYDEISKDLVQANTMIVNFNQHYDRALNELEAVKNREAIKDSEIERLEGRVDQILSDFDEYRKQFSADETNMLKKELFVTQQKILELEKANREANKINALLTKRLSDSGFCDGRRTVLQ